MSGTLKHQFIPKHYEVFSGLDVDKTSIAITFTDHYGMMKSLRIPNNADHLLNYVRKHFSGKSIAFAYEAGPTGYGLYDKLIAQGYSCLVVAPSMVPTPPGQKVKTNRLDSRKISESLRGAQLHSIHVPSFTYRHLRHLAQLRDTYVKEQTAAKLRIKALLLFEGIAFPEEAPGQQWSSATLKKLDSLDCHPVVQFKLNSLLSSLRFAHEQLLMTQREIRHFCAQDPELSSCIRYLTSIPGIGGIVAVHLLSRIGDYRLLSNTRQIAGFLGLVPKEDSTGDKVQRGAITRSGDSRVRNKLIQAGWAAIRRDPELREFYRNVYKKHPKNQAARKAIVAVARKMTTRIYAVLKEQRTYLIKEVPSKDLTQQEIALPQGETRTSAEIEGKNVLQDSTMETEIPGRPMP